MSAAQLSRHVLRRRPKTPNVTTLVVIAVCLVLFIWPVLMTVLGSFRAGYPGEATGWTLDPIRDVYSTGRTGEAISTSVTLALLVTVVAKSLSFYFAWLAARTNTPGRKLITPVMMICLAVPPLFYVLSWAMLGQEKVGLINRLANAAIGRDDLVNINSFAGVAFVCGMQSVAFGYFLLIGPMYALSRPMEEAAAVVGARKARIFRTVTLPVMFPAFSAVLIMGFIKGLEYFEAPLILGQQSGMRVISTEIYTYLNESRPPAFGSASALAALMMLVLGALLMVQHRVQRRRSYETQTGKGSSEAPWNLGRWKFLGTGVFGLFVVLALVLPGVQLVLVSLQPYYGATSGLNLDNYSTLFDDPGVMSALRNTAVLGFGAGLGVMLLALVMVYVIRHGGRWSARFISWSTWVPFSMPGTALALGLLWVLLSYSFTRPLYGTFTAMFLALVIVAMPVAMRSIEPAALQIGRSLEEAAWVGGASRPRAFTKVVAGLVLPSFASGWLLSAILISGNLTMPLMVGSPLLDTVPRKTFTLYGDGFVPAAAALSVVFLVAIGVLVSLGLISLRLARRRSADPKSAPASPASLISTSTPSSDNDVPSEGVTHA